MYTDFFIANIEDVLSINSPSDFEKFSTLQAKRVDIVKVETLDSFLTDEAFEYDEYVKEFADGEVLIFKIRKEFVQSLVKSNKEELESVAKNWAKTDEWILDRGTENDLLTFLNKLKNLVTQSKNDTEDLFLIMSV